MPDSQSAKWTRRAFIGLGVAGVSALGAFGALRRWRTVGALRHEEGQAGAGQIDARTVSTVAQFLGATFGVALSAADLSELEGRLGYAVGHDGAWGEEYRFLADHIDSQSREAGAESFVDAPVELRDTVMRASIAHDTEWRTQRLRAFFRPDGRELLRMRRSTIPHLQRLYVNSGVPWRQRGYVSWPGVADDRLAYTRPLETARC